MKKNIVGIKWPLELIKLAIKPIKSGIVVIFSSKNGGSRRFLTKLTRIDVENDVKIKNYIDDIN